MFLAGHPSQGCFGLQSHCAPCYFFNQASFNPSDFAFNRGGQRTGPSRSKRDIQVSAHITKKFCDPTFVDQKTAHDTLVLTDDEAEMPRVATIMTSTAPY
ncbi:hypothetical protein TNCV_342101 [Trichonephila clavipes]|nr:hypothetical protein TNCV_342101 [Trichonephila clavipes]